MGGGWQVRKGRTYWISPVRAGWEDGPGWLTYSIMSLLHVVVKKLWFSWRVQIFLEKCPTKARGAANFNGHYEWALRRTEAFKTYWIKTKYVILLRRPEKARSFMISGPPWPYRFQCKTFKYSHRLNRFKLCTKSDKMKQTHNRGWAWWAWCKGGMKASWGMGKE